MKVKKKKISRHIRTRCTLILAFKRNLENWNKLSSPKKDGSTEDQNGRIIYTSGPLTIESLINNLLFAIISYLFLLSAH